MDASARESLRKFCEWRVCELEVEALSVGAHEALILNALAREMAALAGWCGTYPPLPSPDDIMSGPDLEQMGAAMAGDAAEMEEQCSECGLGTAGIVRCSRDDCPHDRLRKEVKR